MSFDAHFDACFDRNRPAFAPLSAAMSPFRAHVEWPTLDEWNASAGALRSAAGQPIRFVPQPPRRRGAVRQLTSLYDESIYTLGEVPSRVRTWHDFFNMLVWVTFPATKRAINARQRAALQGRVVPSMARLPSARTREQDALATLDEGGLILALAEGAPSLDEAVARAEVEPIAAAVARNEARVLILGHAIYEHLVVSTTPVRGFVRVVQTDLRFDDLGPVIRAADTALAAQLESGVDLCDGWFAPGLPVVDALFAQVSSVKSNE